MTIMVYECKVVREGKLVEFETKSYAEAQAVKAEGGSYKVRYDSKKTY